MAGENSDKFDVNFIFGGYFGFGLCFCGQGILISVIFCFWGNDEKI